MLTTNKHFGIYSTFIMTLCRIIDLFNLQFYKLLPTIVCKSRQDNKASPR
jgi:hypothetical protein